MIQIKIPVTNIDQFNYDFYLDSPEELYRTVTTRKEVKNDRILDLTNIDNKTKQVIKRLK